MALVLFAFLPSEFWRVLSLYIVRGVDPQSELMEWVRAVSTALLAAVVANIIVSPSGALAQVPLLARVGAMVLALAVFLAFRRFVFGGVASGVAAIIAAAFYFG
ncbi:MAG: AzlD domain-containing protein [Hyphomicrobiales bacterium]|nr:AzlD domain-containing protein [Hyphomicrobiales bacterium]